MAYTTVVFSADGEPFEVLVFSEGTLLPAWDPELEQQL